MACEAEDQSPRFFVAVHVGAGYHAPSNEKSLRSAMKRACLAAASVFRKVFLSLSLSLSHTHIFHFPFFFKYYFSDNCVWKCYSKCTFSLRAFHNTEKKKKQFWVEPFAATKLFVNRMLTGNFFLIAFVKRAYFR